MTNQLTKSELENLKVGDRIYSNSINETSFSEVESIHQTRFGKVRLRLKYFCKYHRKDRFYNITIGSTFRKDGTRIIRSESCPDQKWERKYYKMN